MSTITLAIAKTYNCKHIITYNSRVFAFYNALLQTESHLKSRDANVDINDNARNEESKIIAGDYKKGVINLYHWFN